MKNTQRQLTASTSQPPSSGPSAPAMPPRPDHTPIARARSWDAKDAWIRASDPG